MGLFGGGNSSSTTQNFDKRVAVQGGFGVSGDNNIIQSVDGDIVKRALDSVDIATATGNDGYTKLLDAAKSMFDTSQGLIGQTQKSVADAYGQAQINAKGTIDNRTMIIFAVVAGAVVLAFVIERKK